MIAAVVQTGSTFFRSACGTTFSVVSAMANDILANTAAAPKRAVTPILARLIAVSFC
ncbi:hypothetical protein GCM10017083_49460 [Thalassobaculum fulvum]|uniref:Uncharacterized protein n=1 Tax=Thalassobaculum fulvum TaxID=1633335 RepID=A0A918XWK3_9PROT|nr:hypothetical protein GCM10017083_49460 [Thalassobaculum fulvum]